jgi:hypothetical protein
MQKWMKENISDVLRILIKTREGLGLSEIECRELRLTSLFSKLHKAGYIEGTFFIGYKFNKEGSRITAKGNQLIKELEDSIENKILGEIKE